MRIQLRLAIVRTGRSQRDIASGCGLTENRLSEIVNGWTMPTPREQKIIAHEINAEDDHELFVDRHRGDALERATAPMATETRARRRGGI